jgi:transketolase
MRKAFVDAASNLLELDRRVVLLLGDIGVFGFRGAAAKNPERVLNVGILEQSMVGMGAGLALNGHIPIIHTIAPFLVERALEQIKIDFGYQRVRGNIVTVGGSFDYSALGGTHHCPGDVGILLNVPEVEIFVPGTPAEFTHLFEQNYDNDRLSYFRLSEDSNEKSYLAQSGKASIVKLGEQGLVIAIGPALDWALAAVADLDVTVLYLNSLRPFDEETLRSSNPKGPVIIVEPFYEGTTALQVQRTLAGIPVALHSIGVPRAFIHNYGTREQLLTAMCLDAHTIRSRIERLL